MYKATHFEQLCMVPMSVYIICEWLERRGRYVCLTGRAESGKGAQLSRGEVEEVCGVWTASYIQSHLRLVTIYNI